MRTRVPWMMSWGRVLPLLLGLAVGAGPASAVTIDWVTVGDPGNPADTATNCSGPDGTGSAPCGSVGKSYRISKFEVTNAQYAEFLNAKAADDPLGLYNVNMDFSAQGGITRAGSSGSFTYSVKSGFENKLVNFVSFFDSVRFTNWLNNGQGSGDTETGAYTGSASPNGTFDQGGNVWEWNEEIVSFSNRGIRGWLGSASVLAAFAPGRQQPGRRGRQHRVSCRESGPRARYEPPCGDRARRPGPAAGASQADPLISWPWTLVRSRAA